MTRRPSTREARERWRRGLGRAGWLAESARLAMRGLLRPLADLGRFSPLRLAPARRLVLVRLDGVSLTRLEHAMAEGYMPFLASRLSRGRHVLASMRSGAPASTPAFQAGLFYGVSPAVPGYVWFDRSTGREVRMDRAEDAAALEARLARRRPGLLRGGTSYFSILSGGGGRSGYALLRGRVLDLGDPQDVRRPPHPEPALVATYLADLLSLPESGDLVVLGWRGEGREVVAYAWEFGSHGGVAPEELECFVAHPRSCTFRFAEVVRPSELYHFFDRTYRA
ncbi:MAG TPA: hypothetical protein VIW03_01655, partial [Anaeromyxobacter sp.]